MIYLILCIVCSSLLVFMFRVFDHFKIETYPAIVFNYITCVICGLAISASSPIHIIQTSLHADWLWLAAAMGILYIHVFVLTGLTTLKFGVSTGSVSMKLGLVIPVMLAFLIYHEPVTWYKIVGIICALVAVILCSRKDEAKTVNKAGGWLLLLPLVTFIGNGLCDSGAQLGDKKYFSQAASDNFVLLIFMCAAVTGICYLTVRVIRGTLTLQWNQVLGGVALGIPNYGSLLFLMKALDKVPGGSSVVFPVSNISTVAGSTLLSVIVFREHLNRSNLLGLGFAALCIVFIYLPQILGVIK